MQSSMDTEVVKHYWLKNTEMKLDTAESLFQSAKYADCLFFYHLVTECLLKALVVQKTGVQAPYSHNLVRLAKIAGLEPNDSQREQLTTITDFNMTARYPEIKHDFYTQATEEYTTTWVVICKELIVWIKMFLNK